MGTSLDNPLLKLLGRTFERLEKDVLKDIDNKTTFVLGQVNKNNSLLEQRLVSERKELTDIIGRTFERLDNKTTFVLGQVNKDNSSLEQRLVSERRELIDIICQLHPCTEWEAWTGCSAKNKGTFGAQTRSRRCGVKASKLCSSAGQEQKETDITRICEGTQCPTNYTATTNRYCIGVHTVNKNWTSAQAVCKQEGGYLMNIDSQLKALDVNSTLKKMSLTSNFWIDGTRTLPGGEWRYEYGPQDTTYNNWYSGEPHPSYDCRVYYLYSSILYWRGFPCSYIYYFICEIV
jgi:hypothetical protein